MSTCDRDLCWGSSSTKKPPDTSKVSRHSRNDTYNRQELIVCNMVWWQQTRHHFTKHYRAVAETTRYNTKNLTHLGLFAPVKLQYNPWNLMNDLKKENAIVSFPWKRQKLVTTPVISNLAEGHHPSQSVPPSRKILAKLGQYYSS